MANKVKQNIVVPPPKAIEPKLESTGKRDSLLIQLAILALVGIIYTYANHFDNGFHLDDFHTINENPYIRSLDNVGSYFTDGKTSSTIPSNQSYRPLISLSLAIDYWIAGGTDPFYFHLSTFLWFLLQAVVMYFLFLYLMNIAGKHVWNPYIALFAVSVFCYHTVIAETVNYIIERSDLISTFFVVLALWTYIRYEKARKYHLYLIPYIAGILCKAPAVMFAPILFVYILLFEKNANLITILKAPERKKLWETIVKCIPVFIVFAIGYYVTIKMTPESYETGGSSRWFYLITQPFVILHYFKSFFLPTGLSVDTDWELLTKVSDNRVIIGTLFIALLVYIAFRCTKKTENRPIAFGIFWFFLALMPSSSIIPLSEVMNDHRMYFPYVGLTLAIVWYATLILKKYQYQFQTNQRFKIIVIALAFLIIGGYAYGTYQRNIVWETEESLWLDVTIKSPKNGRGQMNYGITQMAVGKYDTALAYFNRAYELYPFYPTLQVNLGICKNAMGMIAEAEGHYLKAISLNNTIPSNFYFYADFLVRNKRLEEAIPPLQRSISLSNSYLPPRSLLMDIYNRLGYFGKLGALARETLQIDPSNPVALQFSGLNLPDQPIATKEIPVDGTAEDFLAQSNIFYNAGDFKRCIEMCEKALKKNPNFAAAYNNICASYNNLNEWDKAIEACNKAVALEPGFQLAKNNLNWALQNKNKK